MKLYDAEKIREAARGQWREIFERLGFAAGSLGGKHSPCPGCGGNDRFQFDDRDGSGSFLCYRGGAGLLTGDGIAALMHFRDCDFREACSELGELLLGDEGRLSRSGEVSRLAPEPRAEKPRISFNLEALRRVFREEFSARQWWESKSPVKIDGVSPAAFLTALYDPGERILVFNRFTSQGDFIFWLGKGSFRLSPQPGVTAAPSELPTGGAEGVWFLNQPVSGQWVPVRDKLTRRSAANVTAWKYLVLEHDPPKGADVAFHAALWMSFLAILPLPIAAVYTSGGKSIHALIRLHDLSGKQDFDDLRRVAVHYLAPFGADPAAITAVRLTRLPGCFRGKRKQELLYLNPNPSPAGIPISRGGNFIDV